jgi:general secretion pathway protein D
MIQSGRRRLVLAAVLAAAFASQGCAAKWAYRQGKQEADKGNWDLAVARFTKALGKDPDNIGYKIALERAKVQASRAHYEQAKKYLAADDLLRAADELDIASKYDPSNKSILDELFLVKARIRKQEAERERLADYEAMKERAEAQRLPVPMLSPRSTAPITLRFTEVGLEKIYESLGKVAGVNILFDEGFRDKKASVNLTNVSFEEALDRISFVNRLFHKVLDDNTVIIVPDSAANRRKYEEVLTRTFYIQSAEPKEVETIIKTVVGPTAKVSSNPTLGALTIIGTADELALAQRIVDSHDKDRGEVLVELEILEVNRNKLKQFGIELSNYSAAVTFSPTGAEGEVADGFTNVRAHLLSSLNLADFVVQIPSTILFRFLQTDASVRILASPRLRAAEGKKTTLRIGTEVPVPVTTFQTNVSTGPGGTFTPATSFQYRNVGVNLELTPKVHASGEITLELAAEFSVLGPIAVLAGQELPTFLTRNMNGTLRFNDGETSLVGGLITSRDTTTQTGIFGLSSIPILNKLGGTRKEQEDTEILISITPHLVRAPKITEEDLTSLAVGTREMVKVPGARPPLFGEPEETPSPAPGEPPAPGESPAPGVPPPAGARPAPRPTPPPPPASGTQIPPSRQPLPSPAPSPSPAEEGPPPSATSGPMVSAVFSPPEATIKLNANGSVSVVLMGAKDVTRVDISLTYDSALAEAVDVTTGSLLTVDGANVGIEKGMEPGRVRASLARATGVTGSGAVATFTFRGVGAGRSALALEAMTVRTANGAQEVLVPAPARIVVSP